MRFDPQSWYVVILGFVNAKLATLNITRLTPHPLFFRNPKPK